MLAVLVTALAHDVEEQHTALPGVDHVLHGVGDDPGHRAARHFQLIQRHRFDPSTAISMEGRPRRTDVDLGQSPWALIVPVGLGGASNADAAKLLQYRKLAGWPPDRTSRIAAP